jgi:hypothetical protein
MLVAPGFIQSNARVTAKVSSPSSSNAAVPKVTPACSRYSFSYYWQEHQFSLNTPLPGDISNVVGLLMAFLHPSTVCMFALQGTALHYSSNSLWGNWLDVLEAAMAKLLVKAVPAQHFAQQLVATALQLRMPRYWVGPCAGVEWLLRFFPLWLQVGLNCVLVYNQFASHVSSRVHNHRMFR